MAKNFLILKATKDICGDEVGLIKSHCQLLGMQVYVEDIISEEGLSDIISEFSSKNISFDYIYLCTHGNTESFLVNMGTSDEEISWASFSQLICEEDVLQDDTVLLLACCKGGFFQVASDIMACCHRINFVCGVKWNVEPWDLTTGFIVYLHNVEIKKAEPNYAAKKASKATDYTFVCYDRDEVEANPNYETRQLNLFKRLGWVNDVGEWIETDPKIIENVGIEVK